MVMVMVCNRRDFLVCGRAVVAPRYGRTFTNGGGEEGGRACGETEPRGNGIELKVADSLGPTNVSSSRCNVKPLQRDVTRQ